MKPAPHHSVSGSDRQKPASEYLASMSGSLSEFARRNGYETLGYLFELAKLEAENLRHGECAAGHDASVSREHDPETWEPDSGKDHAQTKC